MDPKDKGGALWDTERAFLGGCLLGGEGVVLSHVGTLTPEDFSRPQHENLWRLLSEMAQAPGTVDLVTVIERVALRPQDYDGAAYVSTMPSRCPTMEGVPTYARRIAEASNRRKLLTIGAGVPEVVKAAEDTRTAAGVIEAQLTALIQKVAPLDGTGPGLATSDRIVGDVVEELTQRVMNPGERLGYSTGLENLDYYLTGLRPSRLYVVAARPGVGKTAVALRIARAVAEAGGGVLFASLEMARNELLERGLADVAAVPYEGILTGRLSEEEQRAVYVAADVWAGLPVGVDDTPAMTLAALYGQARRWSHPSGAPLGCVVVDYLQLLGAPVGTGRNATRENVVSENARGLKNLAKALGVPVIALAQLNRESEKRTDARPKMSDLRESGEIEQAADVIALLDRAEVRDPDNPETKGRMEVIVAKQRAGRTGSAWLRWEGAIQRVSDGSAPLPATPQPTVRRRGGGRQFDGNPEWNDE